MPLNQPFKRLDELLRNTARELQSWSQKSVGIINLQVLAARELILRLDQAQERWALAVEEIELRKDLKLKCLGLSSLQRTIARMRSRITWLREGDACTKFFQLHAKHRQQRKRVLSLEAERGRAITQDEMVQELFHHFTNIMGSEEDRTASINLQAIKTPTLNLSNLEEQFTESEIWETIKSMPSHKAPGPDGYTTEFYISAWPVIKGDVTRAMHAFHAADRRGFQGLNNALITLLPKKEDAKSASDYRPICLIHSFAKIAAKTMARRLAPFLGQIVDVNQSAFIKTRSIHDNFRLVQGIAKLFKQRKTKPVVAQTRHRQSF